MNIETLEKYIKVTASEGHYISSYKEGDDILSYSSSKVMFAPLGTDLSDLREITEEEDNHYNELQIDRLRDLEDGKIE